MFYLLNLVFVSGLDLNVEVRLGVFRRFPAKTITHKGELVFTQRMLYLPLSTFRRFLVDHRGERKVKNFSCLDQFFAKAFAQFTYPGYLVGIEVNPSLAHRLETLLSRADSRQTQKLQRGPHWASKNPCVDWQIRSSAS
jgi:hypothetical protein